MDFMIKDYYALGAEHGKEVGTELAKRVTEIENEDDITDFGDGFWDEFIAALEARLGIEFVDEGVNH
jgi:hypothetical protein